MKLPYSNKSESKVKVNHLAGKAGISIIHTKIKILFGNLSDNFLGPKNISPLSLNYVDQNVLFTPLRETTSIPVSVI